MSIIGIAGNHQSSRQALYGVTGMPNAYRLSKLIVHRNGDIRTIAMTLLLDERRNGNWGLFEECMRITYEEIYKELLIASSKSFDDVIELTSSILEDSELSWGFDKNDCADLNTFRKKCAPVRVRWLHIWSKAKFCKTVKMIVDHIISDEGGPGQVVKK